MIDPSVVLTQYLSIAGTPLITLIGNRIYAGRLPESFNNKQPALVFFCRGGLSQLGVPVLSPSYQFKCFGGSDYMQDAKAVYLALHDLLHNITMKSLTAGTILSAYEETMGQELFDPDTHWPYVLAYYTINTRPNA